MAKHEPSFQNGNGLNRATGGERVEVRERQRATMNRSEREPGAFVISLDFELHWGIRDVVPIEGYKENLLGSRKVIPRLLEMFERYGIGATWAIVGFLFCSNRAELLAAMPAKKPRYLHSRFSPYGIMDSVGEDEVADPFHYAPSLIRQIAAAPRQEVATHTFSHFYCLEEGADREAFRQDIEAAQKVAQRMGIRFGSIVFPRNQVSPPHLEVCRRYGINVYRGAQETRHSNGGTLEVDLDPRRRLLRLVSSYVPIYPPATFTWQSVREGPPYNVPASRFLRPYSRKLRVLEPLRMRLLKQEMTYAAQRNEIYHLWWHPHNFGANIPQNLAVLEELLEHFNGLRASHGMRSMNMREVAAAAAGEQIIDKVASVRMESGR